MQRSLWLLTAFTIVFGLAIFGIQYANRDRGVENPTRGPQDEEARAIARAEEANDFSNVVALSTKFFSKDDTEFDNLAVAHVLKALVYLARYHAQEKLGGAANLSDLAHAADLGNIDASQMLIAKLLDDYKDDDSGRPNKTQNNIDLFVYIKMAAELGNNNAQRLLTDVDYKFVKRLDQQEYLYWSLINIFNQLPKLSPKKLAYAIVMYNQIFGDQLGAALKRYAPGGSGIIEASKDGVPGRGLEAAFLVALTQYRMMGNDKYFFDYEKAKKPVSIYNAFVSQRKLAVPFIDNYLLVTKDDTTHFDDNIIHLDVNAILNHLAPGDAVYVRCGPLSHVAMLWIVDEQQRAFYFDDGLFQFWLPQYNSCVDSFELVPYKYGHYLAKVSFDDVLKMFQAAEIIRDQK
jgi:hypothetical protein